MADLIDIMGKLVDVHGKILVPGINDAVAKLTEEEKKLYDPIDFDKVSMVKRASHVLSIIHAYSEKEKYS